MLRLWWQWYVGAPSGPEFLRGTFDVLKWKSRLSTPYHEALKTSKSHQKSLKCPSKFNINPSTFQNDLTISAGKTGRLEVNEVYKVVKPLGEAVISCQIQRVKNNFRKLVNVHVCQFLQCVYTVCTIFIFFFRQMLQPWTFQAPGSRSPRHQLRQYRKQLGGETQVVPWAETLGKTQRTQKSWKLIKIESWVNVFPIRWVLLAKTLFFELLGERFFSLGRSIQVSRWTCPSEPYNKLAIQSTRTGKPLWPCGFDDRWKLILECHIVAIRLLSSLYPWFTFPM